MNLSIQDRGAIGELPGAVAALATLVYLAAQVRQSRDLLERNQKIAIGQAYQFRAAMTSDNARVLLNNLDVISIQEEYDQGEDLTEVENRVRRTQFALGHFAYDECTNNTPLGSSMRRPGRVLARF